MTTGPGKNQAGGRAQQYSPPALRDNNVARARCLQKISNAGPCPVVLIVAGAGCGKSTLLRQLYDRVAATSPHRIWIALEERDELSDEFWSLLSNGFASVDRAIVNDAIERVNTQGLTNIAPVAEALAKGVESVGRRISLFIDDFQFAAESDGAKLIHELVRRQTKNLQIYIASRVTPKLPIEALKVENKLLDLSWRELAFSQSETAQFFEIDPNDDSVRRMVDQINRDTEGWAAGLQLALMKTKLADAPLDMQSASAYSSDVARYFRTEIFDALPPDVRHFLVRTSALDKFNDELAAEVSGVTANEAHDLCEYLRNHGFFLIALEGRGKWLRYHHLVKEYLSDIRSEIHEHPAQTPESVASLWFEKRDFIPDAIEYAIRSGDFDRASDLVEAYAIELFNKGAAAELAAWIGRIPNKIIVKRPQLPLYLCKIYAHMRQPIEGLRLQYERCKQVISTLDAVGYFKSEQELQILLTELDVSEAIIKFRAGAMTDVIEVGLAILERKLPIRTTFLASLHNIMGYSYFIIGENAKARSSLTTARDLHLSAGSVFGVVFAEAFKGMVSLSDGTTTAAQRHFCAALDHAVTDLGADSLPASVARLYLNVFRYEVDAPIDEREFDRALADCRFCCEPEIYAIALVTKYHLVSRRGSEADARAALEQATTYAREIGNDLIYLQVRYTALLHELNNGSVSEAVKIYADAQAFWATVGPGYGPAWDRRAFWRDLYAGEILLATAQPRKAADTYAKLAQFAQKHDRVRRQVLVQTKRAIALASAGQTEQATAEMLKALKLAKPPRFVRTLLDSGPRARALINLCAAQTSDVELKLFIESLPGADNRDRQRASTTAPISAVVLDELTGKEIEILRILTTGAKNREICRTLKISENTVKWHMSRIFQKLGAENRTEAAMIAKSVFASL